MIAAQEFIAVGGQERAIRLLVKAFGENGAKSMVERLTRTGRWKIVQGGGAKEGGAATSSRDFWPENMRRPRPWL